MTSSSERITVTIPRELVEQVDRVETNRSRFVVEAVRRELERRRRVELRRSLDAPHAESGEIAEMGFDEWAERLAGDDVEGIVDPTAGTPIRWRPGRGWEEDSEE